MDPLKRLASAILIRALVDTQKGCPEAREWISEDDSGFPLWCQIYGINPTSARQELCKAIKARPVKELTKELRLKRIAQALTEHPELSNRAIDLLIELGLAKIISEKPLRFELLWKELSEKGALLLEIP